MCAITTEECFTRECTTCGSIEPSDILTRNIDYDDDDSVSWSLWKTEDKKVDLHQITGSISSLLSEIDSQWSAFLYHWHCTVEQRDYIKELRERSSDKTFVVAQVDFAQNYTLVHQRAVQGYHWNNQQVTLFTAHLKIGQKHKNLVVISNHMSHNTAFVYSAQRIIVSFVRDHYPQVTRINYLRSKLT